MFNNLYDHPINSFMKINLESLTLLHGKILLIVLVTPYLKYRYHLNGLNKASRAAKRAIHMCLGGKYVSQKSVPSLNMRCHWAAIQETTIFSPLHYCLMASRVSKF